MGLKPYTIRLKDWAGCQTVPGVYYQQRPCIRTTCEGSKIAIQVDIAPIQGCFVLEASAWILDSDDTLQSLVCVSFDQTVETARYCYEFEPLLAGSYVCYITYSICHTASLSNTTLACVFRFTAFPCQDILRDGECANEKLH